MPKLHQVEKVNLQWKSMGHVWSRGPRKGAKNAQRKGAGLEVRSGCHLKILSKKTLSSEFHGPNCKVTLFFKLMKKKSL